MGWHQFALATLVLDRVRSTHTIRSGRKDSMRERGLTMSIGERETLLRRYLPLVRREARRFRGRASPHVDVDDLIAWGTLGLLVALDRYDPGREALFATFARFRIRGAILDQLRALDWVPRSVREKATAAERVARLLETRLGRPAGEEEMARGLGLSLAAYRDLLGEIAPMSFVSLDDPGIASGEGALPLDRAEPDPLRDLLRRERLLLIADAIRSLPDRDQLLLSLYYRDELTMKEVGSVLGLTESRVSQLHTNAMLRLRATLEVAPQRVAQAG
jgi:RNA polymerase sigma factor for flagellar operon FliA